MDTIEFPENPKTLPHMNLKIMGTKNQTTTPKSPNWMKRDKKGHN